MLLKWSFGLLVLVMAACTSAPPEPKASPSQLEGMWSDPPATAEGTFCFFACTEVGLDRLNALLDDPANDARPFPELQAEAGKHQRENYIRPRLTDAALETYPLDPADDPGFLRCEPWGLARQMFAPHQVEIRQRADDRIELRYGEWDALRTVHMDGRPRPAAQAPTLFGHSVGRWEGETLVVETAGVTADITGWDFQHSDGLRVIERFTRSADGDTLLLTATIEDPWSLREPLVFKKIWRWAPDQQITPYEDCEPAEEFSRGKGQ